MQKRMTDIEIQAEVNRRVEEAQKQWKIDHTPVVTMKYGNTYISVEEYDHESAVVMDRIKTLLKLMNVEYSVSALMYGFGMKNKRYISIEGEDAERAAFIQKFMDNGCALNWSNNTKLIETR